MGTIAWKVMLPSTKPGGRVKHINTVFYTEDCDADYVRTSLINHDGYDPRIEVRKEKEDSRHAR